MSTLCLTRRNDSGAKEVQRVEQNRRKDFSLLLLPLLAVASTAPEPFERFDGSVVEPDEWTDGDDGDNMQVLSEHIAEESVDLIYLDPPFNSKRDYNFPAFFTHAYLRLICPGFGTSRNSHRLRSSGNSLKFSKLKKV